jgi:riboflavin transporter FmnP
MKSTKLLALSGLFLALGLLLPFLTGQIPSIGNKLLPMHLPILLCGFICGWRYGLAIGFVTPLLRSLLFGMPPMFPTAAAMAFELAVYGLLTGLLYVRFKNSTAGIYLTLILSMIGGRIVWGAVSYVFYGIKGTDFTIQLFLAGAVTKALPGIILQLILIPAILVALRRAKVLDRI